MSKEEILVVMPKDLQMFVSPYLDKRAADTGYVFNAIFNDEPLAEKPLSDAISTASAYIVHIERVTEKVLAAAKNLKVVSKLGVGIDNIDCESAKKRGIEVANCPGSNSNAVAELALGLMVSMARNTQKLCNDLRDGTWSATLGSEIRGKCIGLLGLGNVSKQLVKYLKPFDTEILVYDIYKDEAFAAEYGVTYSTLDEIAKSSDFISLHLPLLPATRHIVDKAFLKKTKKGVFILNLARGGIADEQALYEAVQSGQVAQVATDVFEKEPPFGSPILEDERFIVLPHIGAATQEAIINMLEMSIQNIQSVLTGKGNPHPVI